MGFRSLAICDYWEEFTGRTIETINEIFIDKVKEYEKIKDEKKRSRKSKKPPESSGSCQLTTLPEMESNKNKGKLTRLNDAVGQVVDATIAPSNIKYPTDLDLLNDSREISERLIDKLYSKDEFEQKPRTYHQNARQDFLNVIKKKRKGNKTLRKGIRKQIQYLRQNLSHIDNMLEVLKDHSKALSQQEQKLLDTIRNIYAQQEEMYTKKSHSVKDRIVSIHQPYIRPMVRGKARVDTEFGSKISISVVERYVYLDRLKWDAYLIRDSCWSNENMDLIDQVNKYRQRFGHFPAVVIADGIYGTRENRNYLKEHGIRFFPQGTPGGAGKKLGRPPKEIDAITYEMERLRILEQGARNEVEGKIGVAKTRYGLGKVMTKTQETSENWIAMAIFSINMATALRQLLLSLFGMVKNWLNIMISRYQISANREIILVLGHA